MRYHGMPEKQEFEDVCEAPKVTTWKNLQLIKFRRFASYDELGSKGEGHTSD